MRMKRRGSSEPSSDPRSARCRCVAPSRVCSLTYMPSASIQLICSTGSSRTRSEPRTTILSSTRRVAPAAGAVPRRSLTRAVEQRLHLRHDGVGVAGADLPQRAVERGLEPLVAERLEEISDGLRLERAQRVLVVGGDEDDFRHRHVWRIAHEGGKHAEAVELRHLDVEEHQLHGSAVAGAGADGLERFGAAGAASHQLTLLSRASSRRSRSRPGFSSSTISARIVCMSVAYCAALAA